LTHVFAVILLVLAGAGSYFLILFKLDLEIHDFIRDLILNLGIPWPSAL
jgi:hypothetical protein